MDHIGVFKSLRFDEQFLTFFACLNVFLQNDSKLDPRERNFVLRLAQSMGLDWMDTETLDLLTAKKAQSLYHARLLELSQREREHLIRAVIAIMMADGQKSDEEAQHLQEMMTSLALKKWDLVELGEKIKTIKLSDVDINDFSRENQIPAYLAILEFVYSDRSVHEMELARIQGIFPAFRISDYTLEQRRMGLALLVERVLFGKGLCHLKVESLQGMAKDLATGMTDNQISLLVASLFNYHALIQPGFDIILFDRMDEVSEVLKLPRESSLAIMDFFAAVTVTKKDDQRTSPLFTSMRACLASKGSSLDRQELWSFLDQKFGFSKLPIAVRNEALAVVLAAVALDGVSKRGEEIALDEVIELFGCDPTFAQSLISDFNKNYQVKIQLPEKLNMKHMRAEVRRKNLHYDGVEKMKKFDEFMNDWKKYLNSK